MNGHTVPSNRSAGGRGSHQRRLGIMARFLPLLTMVGFTLTMLPSSGCGKGIFTEVTPTTTATIARTATSTATATTPTATASTPTATASTPTSTASTPTSTASPLPAAKEFDARGSGTQNASFVGTCSGVGCGASSKHCECFKFAGTLLSTALGDSSWTAEITVNEDDCTATGTSPGLCCNGDGVLNVTSGTGASASVLALSVTGPFCTDPNSSDNLSALDSSLTANVQVLTTGSTGKFVNSGGTGQVNIITTGTNAYLTSVGEINLGTPK